MSAGPVANGSYDLPIEPKLLLEPLEFMFADHYRQRVLCNRLDVVAASESYEPYREDIAAILGFVTVDLPLHIADEEEGLFPMLSRRCRDADNYDDIYVLLQEEHERDEDLSEQLVASLNALKARRRAFDREAFLRVAGAFAETQRRHLAWENGIVLPLARKRLTPEDLTVLGQGMAQRRGLAYPPE